MPDGFVPCMISLLESLVSLSFPAIECVEVLAVV